MYVCMYMYVCMHVYECMRMQMNTPSNLYILYTHTTKHAIQMMRMAKVSNMRPPWHVIPGYKAVGVLPQQSPSSITSLTHPQVLKAGLLEMKQRGFRPKDWPQSLLRCVIVSVVECVCVSACECACVFFRMCGFCMCVYVTSQVFLFSTFERGQFAGFRSV